ncbi:MAG TPA: type III pantothenate kinase [Flavobacteriales bacterium]|nr:type III pantothenate kinase [Flavobacteriales bacterium]
MLGIIDAGNTRIKAAIFDGENLVKTADFKSFDTNLIKFFIKSRVSQVFIGSVILTEAFETSKNYFKTFYYSHKLKFPLTNTYATPETLGADRLANAVGAFVLNGNKGPVLSIDMGTCIKYDVVDNEGNYLGGSISPGYEMRFKALNYYTQKLPIVKVERFPELIGKTTNNAIASGVCNGIVAEIQGIMAEYKVKFPAIKVFLTGGDAGFFSGSLKNNIFASPLLTLYGLNAIARLNGL